VKRPKRRVWVEELLAKDQAISPEDANYLFNVLRLQHNDVVELFDGSGRVANATLNSHEMRFEVSEVSTQTRTGRPIELYQSMPKGDRWEWIIEKSGELGVDRLVPIVTEHSVVRIPTDRLASKLERWQKIAGSAARQSTSTFTTEVCAPITFAQAIENSEALVLFGDFEGGSISEALQKIGPQSPTAPCRIFVGPEGGFSRSEVDELRQIGVGISLGPRVLRAETAAVSLVALAQATLGDWT